MNYDVIFVNGDSYSESTDPYADFLGKRLGIPVENYAREGSTNKRILRSSIEYLNDLKTRYQNPLVIIGWTFIRRQEVWYYGNNKNTINSIPDSRDSRLITLDYLLNTGEATLEQRAMLPDDMEIHKQLIDFYTDLYLFSQYLQFQNFDYFWFSAARNTDCPINSFPYLMSLKQVQTVSADPRIFRLHEFCIHDWAKDNDPESSKLTGHLSINGHEKFADYLYKLL